MNTESGGESTMGMGGLVAAIASVLGWGAVADSWLFGFGGDAGVYLVQQAALAVAGLFFGLRTLWRKPEEQRNARRLAWLGTTLGAVLVLVSVAEFLVIFISLSHD